MTTTPSIKLPLKIVDRKDDTPRMTYCIEDATGWPVFQCHLLHHAYLIVDAITEKLEREADDGN